MAANDSYIQLQSPADTSGAKLDSSQIVRGGVTVQRQRLDVVNRYFQQDSGVATATGRLGAVVDTTAFGPLSSWALQVNGQGGAPTAWTVNLEASLDGVTFQRILQHSSTDLIGAVKWGAPFPALFFQIYVAALTLGTATGIVCTAIGTV